MAELYSLYAGRSKTKMRRVMTDLKNKCENYRDALKNSAVGDTMNKYRWLEIRPATEDEGIYKRNKTTQWTGYDDPGPKVIKKGKK